MNIQEFEQQYNVKLIPKSKSLSMRLVGFFSKRFMDFWTTYRLPFQKQVKITYPDRVTNPASHTNTLEHELIHKIWFAKWHGPLMIIPLVSLFPLPILFSGRWIVERYAYLYDILYHGYSIEYVIHILWNSYGWCWPKSLMRKWFEQKVKEYKGVSNEEFIKYLE